MEMKEKKIEKSISGELEKYSKSKYIAAVLSKPGWSAIVRYSGPFLKWTSEEIQ